MDRIPDSEQTRRIIFCSHDDLLQSKTSGFHLFVSLVLTSTSTLLNAFQCGFRSQHQTASVKCLHYINLNSDESKTFDITIS